MSQVASRCVVQLHGRAVSFDQYGGEGIPVLLVHGMGGSAHTWGDVPARLSAQRVPVIAVDLPGHGDSARGAGDYSLGAMASVLRDLLDRLDVERVHLVGHSLGGGVCLQFDYQFPERVESLVLVASGGLGVEAFVGLRAAALPGADLVLRALASQRMLAAGSWLGTRLSVVGIRPHMLSPHGLETVSQFSDADRRAAFLATLRSVVGPSGQTVSALDKLYLVDGHRVLIVWGTADPMIPVEHGRTAHRLLPGSRLVEFPGAGHEPHTDDPDRFTDLLLQHVGA